MPGGNKEEEKQNKISTEVRFDRKRSWKEWNWMLRMELEAKKK